MKIIYKDGTVAECPQEQELHVIRHTAAHIMAQAIKRLYPQADFAFGPATENGFYYDVDLGDTKLTDEDLKGNQGSSVPLLVQWDERWGYRQYGNDFMALTGCGPTCLAMVAESRGETKWNPWRVAKMAQRNGYYVDGQGSAWSLMTEGAAKMGLNGTEMSCDAETIRRTLEDGHVIICAMRPGDFTTAGHFLVLAGVTQDGEVIINDPNSRKNSRRTWDLERVVPQIKNLWKYS